MDSTIKTADSTGWYIDRHGNDGSFMLKHPKYTTIESIPSFDEACRLREYIRTGKFIGYIREWETFLEGIRKMMK